MNINNLITKSIESRIEELAIKLATERAERASERMGQVRKGGRFVKVLINEGVHKTAADYIEVCRIDARDRLIEQAEKEAREIEYQSNLSVANKKASKNGGRYIELLSVAERNGLNFGMDWVCTSKDVDEKGANPEFEGERVCYVYPL